MKSVNHVYVSSDKKADGSFFLRGRKKYSFGYRKELKLKGEKGANRYYSSLINLNFYYPFLYSLYFCVLKSIFRKSVVLIFLCMSLWPFFPHSVDVLCSNSTLSFSFSLPQLFLLHFHFTVFLYSFLYPSQHPFLFLPST